MKVIYEATTPTGTQDHAIEQEAIEAVEACAWGRITTFVRGADGRDRSSALRKWENGAWKGIDISL